MVPACTNIIKKLVCIETKRMKKMEISLTEKLNMAIVKGSQAYAKWTTKNGLTHYLLAIMYELLIREKLTQKQLVKLSDLPKQSINKGIKILQKQGYLTLKKDPLDKRAKFCQLTPAGKKYAHRKVDPLFVLEEKTAQKLGSDKMKQLIVLNEEWNQAFIQLIKEQESSKND